MTLESLIDGLPASAEDLELNLSSPVRNNSERQPKPELRQKRSLCLPVRILPRVGVSERAAARVLGGTASGQKFASNLLERDKSRTQAIPLRERCGGR